MNTPYKLLHFLILQASILMASCSPANTPKNETSPTILPTPIGTIAPTRFPSPTKSVDLAKLTTNCVKILDMSPKDVKLRNSLVLSNTSGNSYILNLETNGKTYLDNAPSDGVSVAPDMNKLAYINYDSGTLVIKDVEGKDLRLLDGYDGHFSLIEWLDNENIAINKANDEEPPFTDYSLLILNTLTDANKQFYIGDFPDGNRAPKSVSWSYFGKIVPNSQLTEVIYPAEGDGYPVVLWDIKSKSEIRRVYFSDSLPAPVWSSDGAKILITAPVKFNGYVNFIDTLPYQGGDELFVINDKGEVKRLTYLTTTYKESVYMASSWSPTEEYIAFDLQNRNEPDFGLSILNVNTGKITNFCIHDNWAPIFWSPDGNQIAFTLGNGFEPLASKAYILDLEKNLAFKIADHAIVAGWMTNK